MIAIQTLLATFARQDRNPVTTIRMPADHHSPNQGPADDQPTQDRARRRLELELKKIRSEASAARLEARAAEIEMLLQALAPTTRVDPAQGSTETPGVTANLKSLIAQQLAGATDGRITSWDQLRQPKENIDSGDSESSPCSNAAAIQSTQSTQSTPITPDHQPVLRTDAGTTTVARPRMLDLDPTDPDEQLETAPSVPAAADDAAIDKHSRTEGLAASPDSNSDAVSECPIVIELDDADQGMQRFVGEVAIAAVDDTELDEESARRKPVAWLVSTLVHVAIIVLLAAVSIQVRRPKDQIALASAAIEANEVSMETFEIESSEPESERSEPTPSAVEYELSPVGELAAEEFSPDAPPVPPSPAAEMMKSSTAMSSAAQSLKSDSKAKIQFCGVEGGGNHFVYLVDCSKSMKEGFQSARMELLASIEALSAEQRFYVVFFDAKPDYMRISDANVDEPRSVEATPRNKRALRQWAMQISMDRGRAPYDPLRFALGLKPDVIFLLSDGEFPQAIEDLLIEENRVDNLFGESSPISIVHTISYHSQEGETRMRRIAQQHGGQYRHVPKP